MISDQRWGMWSDSGTYLEEKGLVLVHGEPPGLKVERRRIGRAQGLGRRHEITVEEDPPAISAPVLVPQPSVTTSLQGHPKGTPRPSLTA